MLVPYTWRDLVTLMERELARAHSSLALEETRNASLPPQTPIASADEHARRFAAAVSEYIAFLRDRRIMTVRDYMEPALRRAHRAASHQGRGSSSPKSTTAIPK